jgi:hypothetical protein
MKFYYLLLILITPIILSMFILFFIALSKGYSFDQACLCGVSFLTACHKSKFTTMGGTWNRPFCSPWTNCSGSGYEEIGGVSGLGWVL